MSKQERAVNKADIKRVMSALGKRMTPKRYDYLVKHQVPMMNAANRARGKKVVVKTNV